MLSILIPIYNYNVRELLTEIHRQAVETGIEFEIICFDDNSDKHLPNNIKTEKALGNTKIIHSKSNQGRIQARKELCKTSKFNWLLYLDADVIPKHNTFIKEYVNKLNLEIDAIFGGLAYLDSKPNNQAILRWKYGKKFEEVDAHKRNLNPYQIINSANFLIKKNTFKKVISQIKENRYGLDNYFAALLKQQNFKVLHINNAVYHLGLEYSSTYLNKIEDSIETLLWAFYSKKMHGHSNKLLNAFAQIKKLRLNYVVLLFHYLFHPIIRKNVLGKNPNMNLLQLYKVLYIFHKDSIISKNAD